jgi:putrescine transport system ATP-binding protein
VAVMEDGRIVQVATPAEIYEVPETVYVADFIGDVNILEGAATPSGDGYDIAWAEGQPPFHARTDKTLSKGQKCHLAIRPEKIGISAEKPAEADNVIQGRIIDIAYLGNLSTYHVELPGGQMIKAQTANTRRLSRRALTWEDEVWLSWTKTGAVVLER